MATDDARFVAQWSLSSADNKGLPFAIVDKKAAKLFLFDRRGHLLGSTPVLLGLAPGDHAVPGVGELEPSRIPPADRTTPAGRFDSEPGVNLQGEDVVWFDYDAGLAIHRLRPGPSAERRVQRLASPDTAGRRVSLGCVVVPVAFYEKAIAPVLGRQRGVVYVLPETRSAQTLFGGSFQVGLRRP
ncbi:MAG TPA: L,D-transpeptidase [Burkholderiaceae bacterium]|nr:L,D-transpeptidase [Burkholderiaceae bacterium]